jgi:prolyl 4-hydroxylase
MDYETSSTKLNAQASSSTASYGAYDDFSWAIMDDKSVNSQTYKDFRMNCARVTNESFCASQENWRMQMNMYQTRSVYNYTEMGFLKTKAPKELFQLIRSFFDRNKDEMIVEWSELTTFHNNWEAPTHMVRVDNGTLDGGGQVLYATIADAIRPLVEEWIGMRVAVTSVYGIRVYKNQSLLAPHVDRLPLVSSVIINIDQDVDEDWPLEVYEHQGVAHNITMKPGDIIYYESATVIHGRPFPLKGNVSSGCN